MFDGADEVDLADRAAFREAIEDLARQIKNSPDNRYLITCRSQVYAGDTETTGFRKCEVLPLAPEKRTELIHALYGAVFRNDSERASRRAAALCKSIERSGKRVKSLTTTPLMVATLLYLHHFSLWGDDVELPPEHAVLYEQAVKVLLIEAYYKRGEAARKRQQLDGMETQELFFRLASVAFEVHKLGERGDAVTEEELIDLIWRGFGTEEASGREAARRFIRLVTDRGGLLEERGGLYGFHTHRTFREFLAGVHLARGMTAREQRAFLAAHLDDHWEWPVRLAVGHLATIKGDGNKRADEFVRLVASLGEDDAGRAQALALAGLALSEVPGDLVRPETQRELTGAILEMFEADPPKVEPRLRRRLGLALGAVGDPRLKPGDLPALVPVPIGPFRMGTSPGDSKKLKEQEIKPWNDELAGEDHVVWVPDFEIGKCPVTNEEFRTFVDTEGYRDESYWGDDGKRWLRGELDGDLWLDVRPVEKRREPFFWNDPEWSASNLPVVGVTWYETEAYCNWLTRKLRSEGKLVSSEEIRLPTEAEWEKAARGTDGRFWPWGDHWDPAKCNSREGELMAATPVGMYPEGQSPCTALDMVGNVWEWCSDWWDEKAYEKRAGQEVRNPAGPPSGDAKVVRGGAWGDNRWDCRAACRSGGRPTSSLDDLGFRVVRAPVRP